VEAKYIIQNLKLITPKHIIQANTQMTNTTNIQAAKKVAQAVRPVGSYRSLWSDNLTRLIHAATREADRNPVAREALQQAISLAFASRSESMCGKHGDALLLAHEASACLKGLNHGECGRILAGLEKYASIQSEAFTATQGLVARETAKVNQAAICLRRDMENGYTLRGVLTVYAESEAWNLELDQRVSVRLAKAS
jgi:hypothetical protein